MIWVEAILTVAFVLLCGLGIVAHIDGKRITRLLRADEYAQSYANKRHRPLDKNTEDDRD